MPDIPNDMPPIKDGYKNTTQIPPVEKKGSWLLVTLISIAAIVLIPVFSYFWILMIFPIGMSIVSLVIALKEFKPVKEWIVALVLSVIACVMLVVNVENSIINFITWNSSFYYETYNEYPYDEPYIEDWYSDYWD